MWGSLIGLALAGYLQNRESGKTPNQYPVELTPEQKWWDNAARDTFQNSPTRNFVNEMTTQFMGQIGKTPENMQWLSQDMQGQKFAGGYKPPTFDMSKFVGEWWKPKPGTGKPPLPKGPGPGGAGTEWVRPDGSPLPPNAMVGGGRPGFGGPGQIGYDKVEPEIPGSDENNRQFGFGDSLYDHIGKGGSLEDMYVGQDERRNPTSPRNALVPDQGGQNLFAAVKNGGAGLLEFAKKWGPDGAAIISAIAGGNPLTLGKEVLETGRAIVNAYRGVQGLPAPSNQLQNPNRYSPGVKP